MPGARELLLPWEVSLLTIALCAAAVALYVSGMLRGSSPGFWRAAAFFSGVLLIYAVTQTSVDYYAQYLFFAHRGQHVVLHHLAPFLIALSAPGAVLAAGMPQSLHGLRSAIPAGVRKGSVQAYRQFQAPWIAGLLFVGLIAFWLIPAVHFDAMISQRMYWIMNWSMALDGLLFWCLVLARDPSGITPHLQLSTRVLLLVLIIPPQMLIGTTIGFSDRVLFDVYDICGRALPISALDDQQLGGLMTWKPALMMSAAGVLVLLARYLSTHQIHAAGANKQFL